METGLSIDLDLLYKASLIDHYNDTHTHTTNSSSSINSEPSSEVRSSIVGTIKVSKEKQETTTTSMAAAADGGVSRLASQRAVVIFGTSNCCMCHAVKTLFSELGVGWAVHELDKDPGGKDMEKALGRMVGRSPPVPAAVADPKGGLGGLQPPLIS